MIEISAVLILDKNDNLVQPNWVKKKTIKKSDLATYRKRLRLFYERQLKKLELQIFFVYKETCNNHKLSIDFCDR